MSTSPELGLSTLYLVTTNNTRQAISPATLERTRGHICHFAGGRALLPESDGWWVIPERIFTDRVVPILIVAPIDRAAHQFFTELAAEPAQLLDQHAIFIHGGPIALIEQKGVVPHAPVAR